MKCENCGHQQETGKFCGKCGTALAITGGNEPRADRPNDPTVEKTTQNDQTTEARNMTGEADRNIRAKEMPNQDGLAADHPNEEKTDHVETTSVHEVSSSVEQAKAPKPEVLERAKETASTFGAYFSRFFRQPTLILSNSKPEFKNGMINLIVLVVMMAFTVYHLTKNFLYYLSTTGSVFIPIFGRVFIFLAALIAVIIGLVFITNKLFGMEITIQETLSMYGAITIPVSVIVAISLVLSLLNANGSSTFLISISLFLLTVLIPTYLLSKQITRKTAKMDPLYGVFIYFIFFSIVIFIFSFILVDSGLGEMMEMFSYY